MEDHKKLVVVVETKPSLILQILQPIIEQLDNAGRREEVAELLTRVLRVYNSYEEVIKIVKEYVDIDYNHTEK